VTARQDIGQHGDLVPHRQSLVLQPETVGHRQGDVDLVHAAAQRPVISLAVQDEADAAVTGRGGQRRHDVFGPRHLGHQTGMDKADGLDPAGSGGLQAQDELGANPRVQDGPFVLQAVARSDLDDLDRAAHGRGSVGTGASGGA